MNKRNPTVTNNQHPLNISTMQNNLLQDLTLDALKNVYDMHEAFDIPLIPTAEELSI